MALNVTRQRLSFRQALHEQRQLIRVLQQTIQPAAGSETVRGMRVSVRCTSAEPDLQIGGDLYLAMPLPDGDLLLAVGDVVGHGLAAAGQMMRLRYALATLAAEGNSPAAILQRLNTILYAVGAHASATLVVARFHPPTGDLTWARAGHPPILLAGPAGATPLGGAHGPILGAIADVAYTSATRRLAPGEQVLLYTDGLINRADSLDEWIDQLSARIRVHGCTASTILDNLDYRAAGDDACMLIAQRTRSGQP